MPMLEHQLDSAIQQARIQATLALLPEAYGLALLWRYRDGKSAREMAQLTGKTEKAIERLLARARENFRRRGNDVRRQSDLFYDYRTNDAAYPKSQASMAKT